MLDPNLAETKQTRSKRKAVFGKKSECLKNVRNDNETLLMMCMLTYPGE